MTDFLTDYGVLIALVCAGAAVLYGALVTQRLLRLSPGNERMQEISGAVQEGAKAYLNRQYTDHRRGRGSARDPDRHPPGRDHRDRLRDRRRALGRGRVHRHEPLGARERARRRGGARRRAAGARRRLQGRLGDRAAGRRPGAARRRRLLRHPRARRQDRQGGDRRPDRARLRRLADLRLRPARRRHLHQGRRRRRRSGRQGRGRDPRGRPAQPGGDRRQRRRQRRRLRRHGGRPVRDLRGDLGRRDAARGAHLRRGLLARGRDLSAGHGRGRDHRLDRRRARRPHDHRQGRGGALPGPDRLGGDLGGGLLPDHRLADERPARARCARPGECTRRRQRRRSVALRADRARRHRRPVRDHRLLHVDPLPAGEDDQPGVADRPRDQHHPGARAGLPVDRRAGAAAGARDPRPRTSSPASTGSASR